MKSIDYLRTRRRNLMPSSQEVIEETLKRLSHDLSDQAFVRKHFNSLLHEMFEKTLDVLEECEEKVDVGVLKEAGFKLNKTQYRLLRDYFLSVSQSRKQRGGKDFELQVQALLEKAGIPFEAQPRKERVDLILPSRSLWERDRARVVLLSLKRTLRERWRQVVDELYNLRCPNTYILTAETSLPQNSVQEIFSRSIYLVVWDEVKHEFGNHRIFSMTELMERLSRIHMPVWEY